MSRTPLSAAEIEHGVRHGLIDAPEPQPPYVGTKTPPLTYCNSTTEGNYTGTAWHVRPGADDHLQCLSRGVRA